MRHQIRELRQDEVDARGMLGKSFQTSRTLLAGSLGSQIDEEQLGGEALMILQAIRGGGDMKLDQLGEELEISPKRIVRIIHSLASRID